MDEIERSRYIVMDVHPHGKYELYSEKYDERIEMTLAFYGVDKPTKGAVLELTDGMLRVEEGRPLFSNKMLCFGLPSDGIRIPAGFDVREDYAYLHYQEGEEGILLQRLYG